MTHDLTDLRRRTLAYTRSYRPHTHGSARFLSARDIALDKTLSDPTGPFLGFVPEHVSRRSARVYMTRGEHGLTLAPNGAGKGVAHLIPNLLSYGGSFVVLDPKGELRDITAPWRRTLGPVYTLSFSGRGDARFNPLDTIRTRERGGCERIAEDDTWALIKDMLERGEGKDPYWTSASGSLLAAFLLHVASAPLSETLNGPEPVARTMAEVLRLLALEPKLMDRTLKAMEASEYALVRRNTGIIRQTMRSPEQFTGVYGILMEHINHWADVGVAEATAQSDFDWAALRTPGTTVYLCVAPDRIADYASVLRTFVGCAIRALKDHPGAGDPVTFLLDEFPTLRRFNTIEDSFTWLRGYGLRLWLFAQDLAQLERHYPQSWRSFLASSTYLSFFGVNDLATAKMVSELLGHTTVATDSYSEQIARARAHGGAETTTSGSFSSREDSGSNTSHSYTTNWTDTLTASAGRTRSYTGRPLLMPDEIRRLHPREQILLIRGKAPIRAALLHYYENQVLKARAGSWNGLDGA